MLHTVYSNSYEILRTYLIHTLGTEATHEPFEPIRVVSGSRIINNELMLSIANEQNICAGIDFWTMDNWFHNYVGFGLGAGGQSQEFIWLLWQLLDDQFIQTYPRLNHFFQKRSKHSERDLLRYDLAQNVARVFYKYANYRFDWIIEWMFPKEQSRTVDILKQHYRKQIDKDKLFLEKSEDFTWQKALWEKLGQADNWIGSHTLNMFADWQSLVNKIKLEPSELHFFAPTSVSPLMLPVIKLLSEDPDHHVYVYILNPCQNYWFGSLDSAQSKGANYLRKNAASTRALINRFSQFASDTGAIDQAKPKFLPPTNILTLESLQNLKLTTDSTVERLDLVQDDGQLLHDFQRAILLDDDSILPSEIDTNDRSIRFIRSPTLTREVENIVNIIHSLFYDTSLPNLTPDDILIVTPDIEAAAPIIEATLGTLPDHQRIDYKIVGRNAIDENMTGRALIELGRLLMTPMDLAQLESWLELPIVTQNFNLSLEDLNLIRDWLVTAGFRQGINAAHLQDTRGIPPVIDNGQEHEALDGTLERALERLSWGFVLDESLHNSFDDILPVNRGSQTGIHDVTNDSRLFKTLLTLEQKLQEAHRSYLALGQKASLSELAAWGHHLIELFFSSNSTNQDLIILQGALRAIDPKNLIRDLALGEDSSIEIPATVYWRALEDVLQEEPGYQALTGSVTFTSLKHFRQLPFRVILAFGLNENSTFPGSQHFEEYDLMGVNELKRQDDRDSRSDNRNAFLNLALSARDRFYCSWCIGTDQKNPANPSSVVTEFQHFLSSNLALKNRNANRKAFIEALTITLPLSPASINNFQCNKTQYWKSINKNLLSSLTVAQEHYFQAKELPIVKGPLNKEILGTELDIEELIRFYRNPPVWLERHMGIRQYDDSALDEVPLLGPKDALNMSILSREWLMAFDDGKNVEVLLKEINRNPLAGAINTRTQTYHDRIEQTYQAWLAQKSDLALGKGHHFEKLCQTIEKGHIYNTLVAKNITLYSFSNNEDVLYLCEFETSKSSQIRAKIRMALLNFLLDRPIGLKLYSLTGEISTIVPPSKDLATKIFIFLLDVLEKTIEQITYVATPTRKGWSSNEERASILWRGSDWHEGKVLADSITEQFNLILKQLD